MTTPRATVIIPTFNGEEYLPDLLEAIDLQEAQDEFDVLFIDSGSTDGTLDLIRAHPRARLHEIPNSEFGHGKTRNMAARMVDTEFVLFLTQDAVPAHPRWVREMLAPFDTFGEKMACTFGRQIPRTDCCPTVKRDVLMFFSFFGPDWSVNLQYPNEPMLAAQDVKEAMGFFSDVNSAVRRRILVEEIPYEDVDYAEDQVFGRAVLAAGYMKAYAPLGAVWHSHSYPPMTYLRRIYDEYAGLRAATGGMQQVKLKRLMFGWIRPSISDWLLTRRDPDYPPLTKVKWFFQVPIYNFFRILAIRLAASKNPERMSRWMSLEGRQRAASAAAAAAREAREAQPS